MNQNIEQYLYISNKIPKYSDFKNWQDSADTFEHNKVSKIMSLLSVQWGNFHNIIKYNRKLGHDQFSKW